MATLVGTFFHSHGGTTSLPPEQWVERRNARPIRSDMPNESLEANVAKANRTHEGFRVLRERIAELKPDVLVVFSDDQLECFDFNNYPAFAVYVGDSFAKSPREPRAPEIGRHAEPGYPFPGHPELGVHLLSGVMSRGFDPAFCMDMPKPDRGLAGGVIRSVEELTDFSLPSVPIMMNLYFAPQVSGLRSYQFRESRARGAGRCAVRPAGRRRGLWRPLAHAGDAGRVAERGVRPRDTGAPRRGRRPRHGRLLRRLRHPGGGHEPGRRIPWAGQHWHAVAGWPRVSARARRAPG